MVGDFFNLVLINPLTNLFVLLTVVLGNSGLAVIALTVIIRVLTWPLQLKQMRMTRMMAAISPRLQEIQKKYRDPRRRSEEQMKLYREVGFNPLGCMGSALIQFPIFICLYATLRLALGEAPEASLALADRLYGWNYLREAIPLDESFLWLNLGRPDPFVIPVAVAVSTYVYQKMSSMPPTDERQRAQMNMMNLMMPLIFAWFTLTLPSGVGLYYVLSNIMGMVMQYVYVGGGAFNWKGVLGLNTEPVLPKALEQREKHMDAVRKTMAEDE
ncbi:MAG TPA: YidC/Oxa1 family membrane protein insertase, partial [Dehalococcoidia bacterium]|nr:YidC/Oxa1 family membrane protein insertase [Dehalococcoidia bacterium]